MKTIIKVLLAAVVALMMAGPAKAAFVNYFEDSFAGSGSDSAPGSFNSTATAANLTKVSDYKVDVNFMNIVNSGTVGNPTPSLNFFNGSDTASAVHLNVNTVAGSTYNVTLESAMWGSTAVPRDYTLTTSAFDGADTISGTALDSGTISSTGNTGFTKRFINFDFVAQSSATTLYFDGSSITNSSTNLNAWVDNLNISIDDPSLIVDTILLNANDNNVLDGDEKPGLSTNFTSSTTINTGSGPDNPKDAFGDTGNLPASNAVIFADGGNVDNGNLILGDSGETVDFIQWQTTSPISLAGIQFHGSGDGGGTNRGTELVRFLVEGVEVELFDYNHANFAVDRIFSGGPVTGDDFRIEFTRSSATGPRIFEINAILLVPEPSTLALLGCGLLSLGSVGWRRRRR